jgi:hypothetical protein
MGNHLKYEGIKDILKQIGPDVKPKEPSVKEVTNEWKRLVSTMRGLR